MNNWLAKKVLEQLVELRRQKNNRPSKASLRFEPLEPRVYLHGGLHDDVLDVGDLIHDDPTFDSTAADAAELASGEGAAAASIPLSETFKLHSNPDADHTIYLDFDGSVTTGTIWNSYKNIDEIVTPAYDRNGDPNVFTDSELQEIQRIWLRVVEDFAPFNVDVTTEDPGSEALSKSGSGDTEWGIRVAIGGKSSDWYGSGVGGVAYLNSFNWSSDVPVFVWNKGETAGALTVSHEVGHSLGLYHDGNNSTGYYGGHGSGETSWGPIMGAPWSKNVTTWSQGEYPNANNTEDDLEIITTRNGFTYKVDDHGNTFGSASELAAAGGSVNDAGLISTRDDVDLFSFDHAGGTIDLSIDTVARGPNLDILAELYDSAGNLVASSNPLNGLDAQISGSFGAGTYYLLVDGTGKGDPLSGGYTDYASLGQYFVSGSYVVANNSSAIGESGTVTVDQADGNEWHTVQLQNNYQNAVVVMGAASFNGGQPTTIRVRNVTSNSFQFQMDEYNYLDGAHTTETISYMVLEAGEHTLEDGTKIVAGTTTLDHNFKSIGFGTTFGSTPVVLTTAMSYNDSDAVVTRIENVSGSGFDVKLQEEEGLDGTHATETVGWIAIAQGTGSSGGVSFEAARTGNSVTHNDTSVSFNQSFGSAPVFFAEMQTEDGPDTANVRYRQLSQDGATFFIQEEQSNDSETNHTTEVVGYFALNAGNLYAARPEIGESGTVTVDQADGNEWHTVQLQNNYQNAVVVMGAASFNGGQPTTIRVRNVTSNSFQFQMDEYNYLDGYHVTENISYMVLEAGEHTLEDGTKIVAGTTTLDHNFKSIGFGTTFGSTPVVLTTAMTYNDSDAVVTRIENVSGSGFDVKLQEEEGLDGTHATETVGWIAIAQGTGSSGGVSFEAARTGNSVTHNDTSVSFNQSFGSAPVFFAEMQTEDGGDTANVRYRQLSNGGATFFIQEEQSNDSETNHTTEVVGYFALNAGSLFAASSGAATSAALTGGENEVFFADPLTSTTATIAASQLVVSADVSSAGGVGADGGNGFAFGKQAEDDPTDEPGHSELAQDPQALLAKLRERIVERVRQSVRDKLEGKIQSIPGLEDHVLVPEILDQVVQEATQIFHWIE